MLVPLHLLDKGGKGAEHLEEAKLAVARLDPLRQGRAVCPGCAIAGPPGIAPLLVAQQRRVGQTPDAEFGQDQRLLAGPHGLGILGEGPVGIGGEFLAKQVPLRARSVAVR